MVLSAPPPDDPQGAGEAGWIERIAHLLRLGRRGTLILVDRAADARLEGLVRALLPEHPALEVYTEPQDLADVPAGSVLVLAPRPEHAGWLNMQRPLFAERALKAVLWCDATTSAALARRAPDFFDWVGHRVECPEGVPRFAVAGLRCALRCRAAGIVWRDNAIYAVTSFRSAFRVALPGRTLVYIAGNLQIDETTSAFCSAGRSWICMRAVHNEGRLEKVLQAMRDSGRRGRIVLVNPGINTPGWWLIDGHTHPLRDAREGLGKAGFPAPGRIAALCGLEPGALALAAQLVRWGVELASVFDALQDALDPGASLACLAQRHGLIDLTRVALGLAHLPPIWRAFGADPRVRRLRAAGFPRLAGPRPMMSRGDSALDETVHTLRAALGELYPPLTVPGPTATRARELLAEVEEIVGADDPLRARFLALYACALAAEGRYEDAEAHLRRALHAQQKQLWPEHRDILWTSAHLASVLAAQGRHSEARPLAEGVLRALEEQKGPAHRLTALALAHFAAIRHALGEPGAADDARHALSALKPDDPARSELSAALEHVVAGKR